MHVFMRHPATALGTQCLLHQSRCCRLTLRTPACILELLLHVYAASDRPTGHEAAILKLTDSLRLLETERDEAVGTGEVLTWHIMLSATSASAVAIHNLSS
jgi:hypothetical protein